jgi:hypothetical protein
VFKLSKTFAKGGLAKILEVWWLDW